MQSSAWPFVLIDSRPVSKGLTSCRAYSGVGAVTCSRRGEPCRPRQALQWVAGLCWPGANVDGDAPERHGAGQQEYAHDDDGRGFTPLPA